MCIKTYSNVSERLVEGVMQTSLTALQEKLPQVYGDLLTPLLDGFFYEQAVRGLAFSCRIQNFLSSSTCCVDILGVFAKLRKATISFVMSVRLSFRPHGTTRLPLDGF